MTTGKKNLQSYPQISKDNGVFKNQVIEKGGIVQLYLEENFIYRLRNDFMRSDSFSK